MIFTWCTNNLISKENTTLRSLLDYLIEFFDKIIIEKTLKNINVATECTQYFIDTELFIDMNKIFSY